MVFTHACSRSLQQVKDADGFDPACSSEICYSGDKEAGHEHWFDRMMFAAQKKTRVVKGVEVPIWLSKVAEMQGYGTDTLNDHGHQYTSEFEAPRGTIVRRTAGAFDGEVCFPEPIPFAWITIVHEVQQVAPAKGGKAATARAFMERYRRQP